jgi:hypothetical protein
MESSLLIEDGEAILIERHPRLPAAGLRGR